MGQPEGLCHEPIFSRHFGQPHTLGSRLVCDVPGVPHPAGAPGRSPARAAADAARLPRLHARRPDGGAGRLSGGAAAARSRTAGTLPPGAHPGGTLVCAGRRVSGQPRGTDPQHDAGASHGCGLRRRGQARLCAGWLRPHRATAPDTARLRHRQRLLLARPGRRGRAAGHGIRVAGAGWFDRDDDLDAVGLPQRLEHRLSDPLGRHVADGIQRRSGPAADPQQRWPRSSRWRTRPLCC